MHPGSVAEPEVKVGGQAFFDIWLFPVCYPEVFGEGGNRTSM